MLSLSLGIRQSLELTLEQRLAQRLKQLHKLNNYILGCQTVGVLVASKDVARQIALRQEIVDLRREISSEGELSLRIEMSPYGDDSSPYEEVLITLPNGQQIYKKICPPRAAAGSLFDWK